MQNQSASGSFIERAAKQFDDSKFEKVIINVRKAMQHEPEAAFEKIRNADAVFFAFPLYIYCLPSLLTRFLQDYEAYLKNSNKEQKAANVYAVINCGFPEPYINEEAAGVIKFFCR
jgi:putative NADPH-quinone reductase